MLVACKDSAPVPVDQKAAMDQYGKEIEKTQQKEIPAVQVINGRGEFSGSMGTIPTWLRPLAKKTPWFRQGSEDVKTLAGIAIMAVAKRLQTESDRADLLQKLQNSKDENVSSSFFTALHMNTHLTGFIMIGPAYGTRGTYRRSPHSSHRRF